MKYTDKFITETEELKDSISKLIEILHTQENSNLAFYDIIEKFHAVSREWMRRYHFSESS